MSVFSMIFDLKSICHLFFSYFLIAFCSVQIHKIAFFLYHDHAVVWLLKLLYVWWFAHFWKCNVSDYQSFLVSVSSSKLRSLSSLNWSLKCLNWNSSFVFNKNFDALTTNAKTFKNLIKFVSHLSDHIFFLIIKFETFEQRVLHRLFFCFAWTLRKICDFDFEKIIF